MYNSDQGVYDPSSLAFLLQWLLAQTVEQSLEIQKQSQQGGDQVLMTEVKTIISSLIKEIKGKLREPTIKSSREVKFRNTCSRMATMWIKCW